MMYRNVYRWGIVMILGVSFLSGCGGATPTPVVIIPSPTLNSAPALPTAIRIIPTDVPPTAVPVSTTPASANAETDLTAPAEGTATQEIVATKANPLDLPFLMKIDRASVIVGRGTLLEGRVTHGTLLGGDEVEFLGPQAQSMSRGVLAVLISNIMQDQVTAGDYAGILVESIDPTEVSPGMLLSAAGEYESYEEALAALQQ